METSTDRDIQKYFKGKLGGGGLQKKYIHTCIFLVSKILLTFLIANIMTKCY